MLVIFINKNLDIISNIFLNNLYSVNPFIDRTNAQNLKDFSFIFTKITMYCRNCRIYLLFLPIKSLGKAVASKRKLCISHIK